MLIFEKLFYKSCHNILQTEAHIGLILAWLLPLISQLALE